jgi:prepilin-type N-terminal cleavage/methylation domain-containing protein
MVGAGEKYGTFIAHSQGWENVFRKAWRMIRPRKTEHGFTLTELVVVVAIVGILAMLAIPVFGNLLKRSKTSEVKACLGEIRILEEGYRAQNDTYVGCPPMLEIPAGLHTGDSPERDNMDLIGFYPQGLTRYSYTIDSADSATFTASGEGNLDRDLDTDRWVINETGVLLHVSVD